MSHEKEYEKSPEHQEFMRRFKASGLDWFTFLGNEGRRIDAMTSRTKPESEVSAKQTNDSEDARDREYRESMQRFANSGESWEEFWEKDRRQRETEAKSIAEKHRVNELRIRPLRQRFDDWTLGNSGNILAFCVVLLIGLFSLVAINGSPESSNSSSSSSGKPADITERDWQWVNNRLKREGFNKKQAEDGAKAIWQYEKDRRERQGW